MVDKPMYYGCCQSCAKVFSSVKKHGTELDGTKNFAFCIECYENGSFTEPDLNFDTIKARTEMQIRKRTWLGKFFVRKRLRDSDRWKTNEYF
jgi:hypothetical protein